MPKDMQYDPILGDHVYDASGGNPAFTEGADARAARALACKYDSWAAAEEGDVFGNQRFTELVRGFDSPEHRAEGLLYDTQALAPLVVSGALRDVQGEIVETARGAQATRLTAIDVTQGSEIDVTALTAYER